jgi:TRAP-type C4-dicarboxylate transport system substrate-binding protein
MTVSRRTFLGYAGAAVAAPAVMRVTRANAAEVTLRLHHFLPPVSNVHTKFLAPLAKKIETDSNGRIAIQIAPSMSLGGTPPQLYDQAKDGVADIVWTLPGYTAGRFPTAEVFELPFTANKSALVNSRAAQDFAEKNLFKTDFKDTKVLCFWTHDDGLIHSNKQVTKLDDLKGQKLRFPTRYAGEGLKAAGVNVVGMPVPQVPESLAQRVIDGAVVPWEVVPAVKLQELVKFHTEIAGSPTFYVATFLLVMNTAKYEALPADLKAVIDKNSGAAAAEMAGKALDEASDTVEAMVKKRSGNTVSVLPEDEAQKWMKLTQPVTESWLGVMKEKGQDGTKLLGEAQELIAKYAKA